jgi:glycosyltransferase involved in cell wall biosynthesis
MGGSTERVAIQLISTGGYYGAERALVELAAYLQGAGWHSQVVALEGRGAGELVQRASERGVRAEAFVAHGRLGVAAMLRRLRELLARQPGALLHSHGYKPDILLALLGAPRRFPCVATCHNWISDTAKLRLLEACDKRALRRFDRVIAVSEQIAAELTRSGVPPQAVTVIDNGISAPPLDPQARSSVRAELGVPEEAALLLHVGRLARSKRIDLLLAAVAQLPAQSRATLVLAGEGPEREALRQLAARLGLSERVRFCGYRRDVARLLAAADLFVLSSEREGLPISILEAMALACPIVSTRVGAIPRVLEDGTDAWLIAPGDGVALRNVLGAALAAPELARARARRAQQKFTVGYSQRAMGERYLRIYEAVLAQRPPR